MCAIRLWLLYANLPCVCGKNYFWACAFVFLSIYWMFLYLSSSIKVLYCVALSSRTFYLEEFVRATLQCWMKMKALQELCGIQSPSWLEEPFGRGAEKRRGWSGTCCWSSTGQWWQNTSCWRFLQEAGRHPSPKIRERRKGYSERKTERGNQEASEKKTQRKNNR